MKKSRFIALGIICLLIGSVYFFQMRISKQVALSDAEIKKYDIYKLAITENTTKADIKGICTEIGKEQSGDIEYIKLSSDELEDYLYECKKIEENIEMEDKIYIVYTTNDLIKVSLIYGNEGISQMGIYDEKKDTFVAISQEGNILYKNFVNGKNVQED